MRMGIVYRAENKVTGKCYVGQTVCALSSRIQGHYAAATAANPNGEHRLNSRFARALRKYSRPQWQWTVERTVPEAELGAVEVEVIALYDCFRSGYNSTPGGDFNPMSVPEIAAKHGASKKGITFSLEHRAKLAEAKRGVPRSEETRRRIGIGAKGNKYALGVPCSEKNRIATSLRSRGAGNASAKLIEADVRAIRRLRADGVPESTLAKQFHIHRGTVNNIVRKQTWRHVGVEEAA
jgi:hypothetical protein